MRQIYKVKVMYVNALGIDVTATKKVDEVELQSLREDNLITVLSVNGIPAGDFFRRAA